MKLKYDHAYTNDPKHRFHKKLQKLGFTSFPPEVEHPGKQFCRFISFKATKSELPVYLEFIDARDPNFPIRSAGLSLRALGPLEKAFKKFRKKGIRGNFAHKNYEWKKDSRSRLPGWNFVTFTRIGFRSLYVWITEYEKRSGVKPMKRQIHPNGVRWLHALEIEINPAGNSFFSKVFGHKLNQPRSMPGGQVFYYSGGRATRLKTIVLETYSLKHTQKFISGPLTKWRGKLALQIKNPADMWDILIVER